MNTLIEVHVFFLHFNHVDTLIFRGVFKHQRHLPYSFSQCLNCFIFSPTNTIGSIKVHMIQSTTCQITHVMTAPDQSTMSRIITSSGNCQRSFQSSDTCPCIHKYTIYGKKQSIWNKYFISFQSKLSDNTWYIVLTILYVHVIS